MNILWHVPIFHNWADCCEPFAPEGTNAASAAPRLVINAFWDEIERRVWNLSLNWADVRVYQDSCFARSSEQRSEAAAILAMSGSRNGDLLVKLETAGARLMKTESETLTDVFEEALKRWDATNPCLVGMVAERDRLIAAHVNRSLHGTAEGILFLGAHHRFFRPFLRRDIAPKPVFSRDEIARWRLAYELAAHEKHGGRPN